MHPQLTRGPFAFKDANFTSVVPAPAEFASSDANGATAEPTRPLVTLFGKADCSLCDDVRADLDLLAGEIEFTFLEIDITTNEALFERFRYLIPVVDIDDGELLTPPHSIRRLRDAIAAASRASTLHG